MKVSSYRHVFVLILLIAPPLTLARGEPVALETIVVRAAVLDETTLHSNITLGRSPDPASSLERAPGVHLATGGGISALPIVDGFNDDRLKITVHGAQVSSACANHMNPALSYLDPLSGSELQLKRGLSSVANFGDAIGETIVLSPREPEFSNAPDKLRYGGALSSIYRSNGDGFTESVRLETAASELQASYLGSYNRANSYNDGKGRRVFSTQFEAVTNSLSVTKKFEEHLSSVTLSTQKIPYQGFPNQYMDMVDNQSVSVSALDQATFRWGTIDSTLFVHDVDHEMGFFSDEKRGQMPMVTDGQNYGYSIKAEVPWGETTAYRFGTDFHRFELRDVWPAVPGSMMMGPNDYLNINDGHKQIVGNYAEIEYRVAPSWTTVAGARYNLVQMNTGEVRPYSDGGLPMHGMKMMDMGNPDAEAARAFNDADRGRVDSNLELNLQAQYEPKAQHALKFGYTRKVRSPNLYERYAWGRGVMATSMIGWFGDANGYVGDIDLDPETAHSIDTTFTLSSETRDSWKLSAKPYWSYVEDFIDVESIGTFHPRMTPTETRQILRFVNRDARIFGLDIEASARVLREGALGEVVLYSTVSAISGERVGLGTDLYRMMPVTTKIGAEHRAGRWESAVELRASAAKTKTDPVRDEPETDAFTVVGIRTGYVWKSVRLDLGIQNVFDSYYELPLGGVDYANFAAGRRDYLGGLPGMGRSLNLALTYTF